MSSSPFPIARSDLQTPNSPKLSVNLKELPLDPDDNNYMRNMINNVSLLIITQARKGAQSMRAPTCLSSSVVEELLAGLQANFPDTQFVDQGEPAVSGADSRHYIKVFWT